jgi:hypothetical protein
MDAYRSNLYPAYLRISSDTFQLLDDIRRWLCTSHDMVSGWRKNCVLPHDSRYYIGMIAETLLHALESLLIVDSEIF